MRSFVMLTPSYSCHCVMNSSALSRSPLKIRGGFPTSLSPHPPGTIGAGGRGTGAGGPPPLGNPPGASRILHHQEILQEILLVVLPLVAIPIQMEFGVDCLFSLLCSGGPLNLVLLLRYRAASLSSTCPVCGLIVPTGTGMVSV
jgi:hypothetical protein